MKNGTHPDYSVVTVTCACGASFVTRSTQQDLRLEICSKCHPFFTGKQKLVDSAGRVERFKRRYSKQQSAQAGQPGKSSSSAEPADKKDASASAAAKPSATAGTPIPADSPATAEAGATAEHPAAVPSTDASTT